MTYRHDNDALTVMDWFCGAGGSSQGMHAIPGVRVERAANHWDLAIDSHERNFADATHYRGDIRKAPVWTWPVTDIFWASPECTNWSIAKGKKRTDFTTTMQGTLEDLLAGRTADGDGYPDEDARERAENEQREKEQESRALMEEVPLYLRGVQERGGLVKAGVVENVTDVRKWDQWDRWLGELHKLGYRTRVIALNSMHANPRSVHAAPQSRDRLYVAYWHRSLGRTPDWDKWLRPRAWCPTCQEWVQAVQSWKRPGQDMGRYRQQYDYRCPNAACLYRVIEPEALPAAAAIDWTIPGQRIGDRAKPLADKTLARIQAGLDKFARPITLEAAGNTFERRPGVRTWPVDEPLTTQTASMTKAFAHDPMMVPAGGTWRNDATSVFDPMPARTTRENDGVAIAPFITELRGGSSVRPVAEPLATVATSGGHHGLAVPPLLIPVEGRDGKEPASANSPLRTQTARNETGLAWLPFMVKLRGGGDQNRALPIHDALGTVSADGNHHGLVTADLPPAVLAAMIVRQNTPRGNPAQMATGIDEPVRTLTAAGHQSLITWEHLLVPYYGNGTARRVSEPIGALSTRDRYALVRGEVDINDVLFRMLEPHEIGRAMSFADDYIVLGNKRQKVKQYGNAVTPNVAEIIVCALTECITGEEISRYAQGSYRQAA